MAIDYYRTVYRALSRGWPPQPVAAPAGFFQDLSFQQVFQGPLQLAAAAVQLKAGVLHPGHGLARGQAFQIGQQAREPSKNRRNRASFSSWSRCPARGTARQRAGRWTSMMKLGER